MQRQSPASGLLLDDIRQVIREELQAASFVAASPVFEQAQPELNEGQLDIKNTMKKSVAIPMGKLHPSDGRPFKVKDDDEMNTLIKSIQAQGILSPLIVRPIENTGEYEVISGHRRLHAAQKAGITEIPALIYALDRDAAAIAVVDSNLHREHILPSEKAFAYKLKMEVLSRQGKRTDLTLS